MDCSRADCSDRALSWAVLGLGIGLAQGLADRSRDRLVLGLVGGGLGGFLGGFLFEWLRVALGDRQELGQAIGIVTMGAGLGLCLALVEQALRRAWVQVQNGRQEGRTYLLSHSRSRLGLDERAEVGLFGDATVVRRHAEIESTATGFQLHALAAPGTTRINGTAVDGPLPAQGRRSDRAGPDRPGVPSALTSHESPSTQESAIAMVPSSATAAGPTAWSLEVVRGREVGRILALTVGENVLGNGLNGSPGLDLRDQEAGSPRRMAARQAVIEANGAELSIRDLDSPGGTFVNLQRLLAGQARRLQPGDEIQLGGVRLRLLAAAASPTRARAEAPPSLPSSPAAVRPAPPPMPPPTAAKAAPGRPSAPFSIGQSVACRTWDDFLIVAAQRWRDLRDELDSGRLADYLRQIGRTDLLPGPAAGRSSDDRLDEWLSRLPVTQASSPELDVHPASLELRTALGGITRHVLRITNVGFRLLRGTLRIEPAGTTWLRLGAP